MTGTMITVAPAGPVPLDDLVSTAKECEALGAAVIHVPAGDAAMLRDVVAALRASTDLIVQLGDAAALDAGPESATLAVGAGDDLVDRHTRMRERGIVAAYRIGDPGDPAALARLLDTHGLPFGGRVHACLVMGASGGLPGTAEALVAAERMLRELPAGTTFSATGLGQSTLPVMLTTLAAGGHLRVGTADTHEYATGRPAESDMQLVARAVGLAQLAQRPPLTPREARRLLGVRS